MTIIILIFNIKYLGFGELSVLMLYPGLFKTIWESVFSYFLTLRNKANRHKT